MSGLIFTTIGVLQRDAPPLASVDQNVSASSSSSSSPSAQLVFNVTIQELASETAKTHMLISKLINGVFEQSPRLLEDDDTLAMEKILAVRQKQQELNERLKLAIVAAEEKYVVLSQRLEEMTDEQIIHTPSSQASH